MSIVEAKTSIDDKNPGKWFDFSFIHNIEIEAFQFLNMRLSFYLHRLDIEIGPKLTKLRKES